MITKTGIQHLLHKQGTEGAIDTIHVLFTTSKCEWVLGEHEMSRELAP